jgi:hypothetical protein
VGDAEHALLRALRPPRLERVGGLQLVHVRADGVEDRVHAFFPGGHARQHRRHPHAFARREQGEHGAQLGHGAIGALAVGLVHHVDVRDLQHAGLDGLHVVAEAGHAHHHHGVGGARDLHLVLAYAHRLHEDGIPPGRVHEIDGVRRGPREAAQRAARGHAADEHAGIEGEVVHADAVAEDGAPRVGRGRIDGDDPHGAAPLPGRAGEGPHQRALAAAGRAGDADHVRASGLGKEPLGQRLRALAARFNPGEPAREGAHGTGGDLPRERLELVHAGRPACPPRPWR